MATFTFNTFNMSTISLGVQIDSVVKPSGLAVGMTGFGGVIIYLFAPGDIGYTDGYTGIVAATVDVAAGEWGLTNVNTGINFSFTGLGQGLSNTNAIIAAQGVGPWAANRCRDYNGSGFNDWFLPSGGELQRMYQARSFLSNLSGDFYWSSTDFGPSGGGQFTDAYYLRFSNGLYLNAMKTNVMSARPCRYFTAT